MNHGYRGFDEEDSSAMAQSSALGCAIVAVIGLALGVGAIYGAIEFIKSIF